MDTHILNIEKKRLEPIDNLCVFCGKGKSGSQDDNFYIPLFKEGDRLNVVVYRKVSFKRMDIGLARCPHCKEIHERQKKRLWLYTILGGMLTSVIAFYLIRSTFEELTIFMALMIGVLGGMLTFLISRVVVVEKSSLKRDGILNKQEAALQYKIVKGLILDGWSFNQPVA